LQQQNLSQPKKTEILKHIHEAFYQYETRITSQAIHENLKEKAKKDLNRKNRPKIWRYQQQARN
jgi:hypothetical protein